MSWQAAIVRWAIKRKMRRDDSGGASGADRLFGVARAPGQSPEELLRKVRATFDDAVASLPAPKRGSRIKPVNMDPIRGEWITAPQVPGDTKRVIFYAHGGGYFWGSLPAPRNMLARLSSLTGARVFSLEYRLAPEAPFPAALDDARAAYAWLINAQGIDPGQLVLSGDSAGGGLMLALLAALKAQGQPLPRAAYLFSPWTDLTVSGASITANAAQDVAVTESELRWAAGLYLNGQDAASPLASPLFADLSGLPPLLVQVGSTEILFDDSKRLCDALRRAGGDCTLDIWPDMHHVWQLHSYFLPEGRKALKTVAAFIDAALAPTKP